MTHSFKSPPISMHIKMRLAILVCFISLAAWSQNKPIKVDNSTVQPNENARSLINTAISYSIRNHPNNTQNYSCIEFRKIEFRDSTPTANIDESTLIESFTEIKHALLDRYKTTQLSGKIEGKVGLVHRILYDQLNPFITYNDTIQILNLTYRNPLSKSGSNLYNFAVIESFTFNNDTLTKIVFNPISVSTNTLTGYCHIHKKSGAVQFITLKSNNDNTFNKVSIEQRFSFADNKIWFPETTECNITVHSKATNQQMVVRAKNQITAVDINPYFDANTFATVNASTTSTQTQPKQIDRTAIYLVDSLEKRRNDDRLAAMQTALFNGYINHGYVKIDYRKLIDYNSYEGLKLGIGLWTNEKVSAKFETGGYYVRSIKLEENKYGAGFNYIFNKKLDAKAELSWYNDFDETGTYEFIDGYKKTSSESFRKFLTESMDRAIAYKLKLQTRVLDDFKVALFAQHKDVTPNLHYRFVHDSAYIQSAYQLMETGIKVRWQNIGSATTHNEKAPVVWGNISIGNGDGDTHYQFSKSEFQVQQAFKIGSSSTTTIRINTGFLSGSYPASILYSAFGSYKPFGIEIPYTFGTMRLNEFAANRFGALYLNHQIPLFKNSSKKFKPQLNITTNIGKGDVKNGSFDDKIATFNKGYYESGIVLNNLYSIMLIDYGFSVHYRYGYYHLPDEWDNFAFKVSIRFNIE